MTRTPVQTDVEPTADEVDRLVGELEHSWTATVTVKRQSPKDVGYREIYIVLDGEQIGMLSHGDVLTRETPPGPHQIQANNTLFRKTIDFTLAAGEHVSFTAINRAGWGTYSVLAFFIGFLGAGPFYLTFEREGASDDGR